MKIADEQSSHHTTYQPTTPGYHTPYTAQTYINHNRATHSQARIPRLGSIFWSGGTRAGALGDDTNSSSTKVVHHDDKLEPPSPLC